MTNTLTTWRLHWQRRLQGWHRTLDDLLPWRADRLALWLALIGLVLVLLGTLVWLAGRYEASQVQAELERDTQDAVSDLRTALARDVQALQGVQSTPASERSRQEALQALLRDKREWLRVEQRDPQWQLLDAEDSPLRAPTFNRISRDENLNEMVRSCLRARQFNGPAYSGSYYLPMSDGLGMEVMELCMPQMANGRLSGYLVLVYRLQELLVERLVAAGVIQTTGGNDEATEAVRQFTPLLEGIAAVARGDGADRAEIEATLEDLERKGWHLRRSVERIWGGDRNRDLLVQDLDPLDRALVEQILALLKA